MTTVQDTLEDGKERLRAVVLSVVKGHPALPVSDLLISVASRENVDIELVASAMWDLVDNGQVHYGTDANVRPASAA